MGITATDDALTRSVDGGKPFIGIETHLFELVFDVGATVGATVEVDVEDFMKTGVDHSNNNNNNNTDDDFVFIILIGGYSFDLLREGFGLEILRISKGTGRSADDNGSPKGKRSRAAQRLPEGRTSRAFGAFDRR